MKERNDLLTSYRAESLSTLRTEVMIHNGIDEKSDLRASRGKIAYYFNRGVCAYMFIHAYMSVCACVSMCGGV